MKFLEALAALREIDRAEWGDTVLDDLETAYTDDSSVFDSKIATLEAGNGDLSTQISSLKNELYDLSKLVPAAGENEESEEDEEVEEDELPDVEDFFREVE